MAASFNPTVTSATPPVVKAPPPINPTVTSATPPPPPANVSPQAPSSGPTTTGNQPQPVAPAAPSTAPATVSPLDATYYQNLAALKLSLGGKLAGLANTYSTDQAGYNSGTGTLTTALPGTLANTRNTANSQGLLESGILAQRAGENEATYAQRMGTLLAKWQQQQQTIGTDTKGDTDAFNQAVYNQAQASIARSLKADLANSPTTPAGLPATGFTPAQSDTNLGVDVANQTPAPTVQPAARAAVKTAGKNVATGIKAAAKAKAKK